MRTSRLVPVATMRKDYSCSVPGCCWVLYAERGLTLQTTVSPCTKTGQREAGTRSRRPGSQFAVVSCHLAIYSSSRLYSPTFPSRTSSS